MQQFEYYVMSSSWDSSEHKMNELGKEGWEFVTFSAQHGGEYIFKRLLTPNK